MKEIVLLSLPLLFLILNRWRGSRIEEIVGVELPVIKNGAPIAAVGLLGVVYLLTFDYVIALAAGIAYFIGEAPGWAKWIRAVPYWGNKTWQDTYNKTELPRGTGKTTGIHWLATRFVDEKKDFETYTKICLVLRGILWWIPVYGVFVYFGLVNLAMAIIAVMLMGLAFPITYYIGWKMSKTYYISRAEQAYGFVQGIILAVSLYL